MSLLIVFLHLAGGGQVPARQRLSTAADTDHIGKGKRAVEVRKQGAVPRCFKPQKHILAGVDLDEDQPLLAGKMPGHRAGCLIGGGKVDETVAQISGGTIESSFGGKLLPF